MVAAHPLLTRDAFREGVFARDGHRCVVPGCGKPAVDAHHLVERALWTNPAQAGGYFLANGASVCELHHRLAETNILPPDALRRLIGAPGRVLPEQLDPAGRWDKWGKPLALPPRAGAAIKYPSTPYLPWSGTGDPDQQFAAVTEFVDVPLVATVKMDGANVKLTRDLVAGRNGDHADHPQFDRLKALHASLRYQVPEGLVVFAEWLRYTHSIAYCGSLALPGPLLVFAVYDPTWEIFLGWDEVVAIAGAIGLPTAPVVWSGTVSVRWRLEHVLHEQASAVIGAGHEGLVVRSALPFAYGHFSQRVAKHVRPNHVQLSDETRSLAALNDIAAGA